MSSNFLLTTTKQAKTATQRQSLNNGFTSFSRVSIFLLGGDKLVVTLILHALYRVLNHFSVH